MQFLETKKESSILETFLSDISSHINELDDIYKVSQKLSNEDDKSYDELEDIKLTMERHKEELAELSTLEAAEMEQAEQALNP